MKIWKDKKIYMMATGMVLMTTLFVATSQAGYIDPGSESDPIVSKTYVDKKINELKSGLDLKLEKVTKDIDAIVENNKNNGGSGQAVSETFEAINLKKGEIIIADASTEIILRAGAVNAIGSKNGGLSDITGATDLQTGQEIKLNHLLIVPRSDGRGIEVKSNSAVIMIKGKYTVN